jgi:HlyD family secretion protein
MTMKNGASAIFGLVAGVLAMSVGAAPQGGIRTMAAAEAQNFLQNMLTRLRGERLPAGIVKSNGRIEATQINISSKYPGRLVELNVEEGSSVTQGQVIGKISSPEVEAQLTAAEADAQRARHSQEAAEADIQTKQSALDFAKSDYERGAELVKTNTISKQTYDQRKRNFEAATSALASTTSQRDQAIFAIKSAEAQVQRFKSIIDELTIVAPRNGRVQYRLARAGEVVAAGTPLVTLLDLTDVYMTLFLPAADAGRLEMGGEARLILDPIPQFVVPAKVTFVAADAQFTPKTVETREERTKLMFRVKLKIDEPVLVKFYTRVRTGVRGEGFVRTDSSVAWPADLQVKLPAQ